MILFGQSLDGEAALRRGLVFSCVDDDDLLDEATALAARAASFSPELIRELKATLAELRVKYKDSEELDQKYIELYGAR